MSLGNSNMAGNVLGTAFSLLLLASIIQGLQNVDFDHYKTMEAAVGQNITLPCIVKNGTDFKIVSIEWSRKENERTKLALYSPGHGVHLFQLNVTIKIEYNDAKKLMGSYLHLPEVTKWNSGIYTCDVTAFPDGTIRIETELTVKDDIQIMCDVKSPVEVHNGENVTIRCKAFSNPQYRWTKNKTLVSDNGSLELWWVTDADAGVYTLTVSTGNKSLHQEFTIMVLTATTSLRTVSPQGLTESADISHTTSLTSSINSTHISVTSSPATHSDTNHSINSTTSSHARTVFRSTQEVASDERRNESNTVYPEDIFSTRLKESSTVGNMSENTENSDATPTVSTGRTAVVTEDKDTERSHWLIVVLIVPMLVLIAVVGLLFRRHILKKRMDLPPPFKPPPPPVKYTAARHNETFPISRCNSVTKHEDMT
ncbi:T-cell surface protein tactile [Brachyistius frenatus]|uniref:T-cell surface protein tactile n=1 Tax=Brachyistius frenatus TaxID=100188 RepID=UPI0037E83F63